jgi:ABC-type uncharacterized transport system permease subunit
MNDSSQVSAPASSSPKTSAEYIDQIGVHAKALLAGTGFGVTIIIHNSALHGVVATTLRNDQEVRALFADFIATSIQSLVATDLSDAERVERGQAISREDIVWLTERRARVNAYARQVLADALHSEESTAPSDADV